MIWGLGLGVSGFGFGVFLGFRDFRVQTTSGHEFTYKASVRGIQDH